MIRLVLKIAKNQNDYQDKNAVSVLIDLSLQITEFWENINHALWNALIVTIDKISLTNSPIPSIFFTMNYIYKSQFLDLIARLHTP